MTTATHTDTLLDALRRNLDLLSELAIRYDVETLPEREADPPTVSSPEDVCRLVGPEMSQLAQEQVRVLLLDRKNHVVGQRVDLPGELLLGDREARRGLPPRRHRGRPPRHSSS